MLNMQYSLSWHEKPCIHCSKRQNLHKREQNPNRPFQNRWIEQSVVNEILPVANGAQSLNWRWSLHCPKLLYAVNAVEEVPQFAVLLAAAVVWRSHKLDWSDRVRSAYCIRRLYWRVQLGRRNWSALIVRFTTITALANRAVIHRSASHTLGVKLC